MYDLQSVPRAGETGDDSGRLTTLAGALLRVQDLLQGAAAGGGRGAAKRRGEVDAILELRSHPDPNVRLTSIKIEEFHALRRKFADEGSAAAGAPGVLRQGSYRRAAGVREASG